MSCFVLVYLDWENTATNRRRGKSEQPNFRELRQHEVRRIPLLRISVNKVYRLPLGDKI
jgi:hypothetical protein